MKNPKVIIATIHYESDGEKISYGWMDEEWFGKNLKNSQWPKDIGVVIHRLAELNYELRASFMDRLFVFGDMQTFVFYPKGDDDNE